MESDGIEAFLEESLGPHSKNVLHKLLFLRKELLFASLVAPILPGCELHVGAFVPGSLAGQFQSEEDSLFECGLSDHIRQNVLLLLELLALHKA